MSEFESSVIIPVFNQWSLTRACLKALAATIAGKAVEVIVIDNASSDATPEACPFLGKQLFGTAFRYHRSSTNLNFGPASNLGAKLAKGKFLIFLNNDTIPLQGWYQPLIDDFLSWPDIAATGPLLLYPESEPFGFTVQHLGVFVSPILRVGHLYEGIPADCALAKKRRFFQIITAACMVMRRSLFMEAGLFDENYVNGFEDVDLCARLSAKGYRMTVNPQARVVHHTSQTPGRHQHEEANSQYFISHSLSLLVPDWHLHLKKDGMFLRLGEWQTLQASLLLERCTELDKIAAISSCDEVKALLARYPFWENGWRLLTGTKKKKTGSLPLDMARFKLYPSPDGAMGLYATACASHDKKTASGALGLLTSFCKPFEEYRSSAESVRQWCSDIGLAELAEQYTAWLDGAERFKTETYEPFLTDFWEIARNLSLHPHLDWAYTLWRHNIDLPRRRKESSCPQSFDARVAFSILMPVFNPKAEHLVEALESVIAQEYPHWELCIADDASTDPLVRILLSRYAQKDSRIHIIWRQENGHISAATNTALEMAQYAYAVLMDQDDALTPDALRVVAEAISEHPDGLLFYSDEDKIHDDGFIFYPYFKNGRWDWDLLYGQNFVSHLGVYRTDRMRQIGGFREGFRGSQDFDMLLRYTAGAEAAQFVHIPRVLYHWRAHAGSTALDVGVKSEAVDSARRAVQEHLVTFSPGAEAEILPGSQFLRVKFPLPERRPLVSLICAADNIAFLHEQLSAIMSRTTYGKYEVFFLISQTLAKDELVKIQRAVNSHKNVHLVICEAHLSLAERLMLGAGQARGEVLGFLSGGTAPLTESWLEELVSSLWRDGVGAVGGKLLRRNGTVLHAGYLTDASGYIRPVFQELSGDNPGWFNWNKLARTVDALDNLCIFTRAATLAEMKGFNTDSGHAAVSEYCLRLGEKGLRTIWWPFAEFMLLDERAAHACGKRMADSAALSQWVGRLVPFNENIWAAGEGWKLCVSEPCGGKKNGCSVDLSKKVNKAQGRDDFCAADYLALYPDVRASGMDPLEHYLRFGRGEGRKPCRSKVDYSRLTPERLAAYHAAPAGDIVVCTSIAGGYERLLPPAFLNDGWRYVCFADTPMESYGIWDVRPIPYENADPTRKSRWAKLHLPELFPEARLVLWQDANIVIAADLSLLLRSFLCDQPLYSVMHPVRDCVYDEALACIQAKKDEPEVIRRQIASYREQGMPARAGLYENNFFLLNPRHPQARLLFSSWWNEYDKYSKRDQISLPYVLHKSGIRPGLLLPKGQSAKNNQALYFLTHEETEWIRYSALK